TFFPQKITLRLVRFSRTPFIILRRPARISRGDVNDMPNQDRLTRLLRQHLSGNLTPQEQNELSGLVSSYPDLAEEILARVLSEYAESGFQADHEPDKALQDQVLENVLAVDKPLPRRAYRLPLGYLGRFAAAAM